MQYYSVYETDPSPANLVERADKLAFVKDGFSLTAFFFGALWLIYQRMWIELVVYVAVFSALEWAAAANQKAAGMLGIAMFGLTVLFALEASDLRIAMLRRRGYKFAGVAIGRDRSSAELSFFRSWLPLQGAAAEEPERAPIAASVSQTPKPLLRSERDEVIGSFPNA